MESFVMYRSFHEALKELTREQYGNVMYAINEYALDGVITEELTGIEKAVFLMAKPQLDANRQRRENGAQGGRPRKETEKPMVNEIKNQTKPEVLENNEIEKPNVNVNANENENDNSHTACACEPFYFGKLQKDCWELVQEHSRITSRSQRATHGKRLFHGVVSARITRTSRRTFSPFQNTLTPSHRQTTPARNRKTCSFLHTKMILNFTLIPSRHTSTTGKQKDARTARIT